MGVLPKKDYKNLLNLMRKELKEVIDNKSNPNKVYGLDQESIQQFVASINSILQSRESDKKQTIINYEKNYEKGVTEEIVSDYVHYHELDNQYLKQYGIVRIIGITEAIIDTQLSSSQKGLSVVEKVLLLDSNISISELKNWIKLRNEIVHRPFEHYSPTTILAEDIQECMLVSLRILTDLKLT